MKLTEQIGCPGFTRAHNLRHLFISRSQEAGTNVFMVADVVGQTSIETTRRYTHLDEYELDDADFDDANREVRVRLTYHATGDQVEDAMYWGNEIDGAAEAVIGRNGHVTFEEVTAEIISPEDEDEGEADTCEY